MLLRYVYFVSCSLLVYFLAISLVLTVFKQAERVLSSLITYYYKARYNYLIDLAKVPDAAVQADSPDLVQMRKKMN